MTKALSAVLVLMIVLTGCEDKTKEFLFEQGVKQLHASNPGGAVVYFENALEKDANFTDARFELAKAYAALGNLDRAEREFSKVRTQNPHRDEVALELAKLYNAAGKGSQAFKLAEELLTKHPASVEVLEILGESCVTSRKYEDAEFYLQKALKLDPERAQTKLELAALNIDALANSPGTPKSTDLRGRFTLRLREIASCTRNLEVDFPRNQILKIGSDFLRVHQY